MAELLPSKQIARVRFSPSAPKYWRCYTIPMLVWVMLALSLLIALLLYEVARIARHIAYAKRLGRLAVPYSRVAPDARTHILLIGDSTAYGTGASSPEASLAGLLGALYPESALTNHAENAMSLVRLVEKLGELPPAGYTNVFIHIGGVDALSFTPLSLVRRRLIEAINRAKAIAGGRVVVVSVNNTGSAPAFRFPFAQIFSWRSRLVSEAARKAAAEAGATHVALWLPRKADPLRSDFSRFYAPDGLHPSDAGYALWHQAVRSGLV